MNETNQEKIGFMRGMANSLMKTVVPPQQVEGEMLAPEMPETLEQALQMIAALQEENTVLKQQLSSNPSPDGMEIPPTV